jgi:hypothetical protein
MLLDWMDALAMDKRVFGEISLGKDDWMGIRRMGHFSQRMFPGEGLRQPVTEPDKRVSSALSSTFRVGWRARFV